MRRFPAACLVVTMVVTGLSLLLLPILPLGEYGLNSCFSLRSKALELEGRPPRRTSTDVASPAELLELLSQVQRDLEPWQETGITLDMVEKAYCTEAVDESMRIQIINGSAFLLGPTGGYQQRARMMQLSLMELVGKYKLPDIDAIFITSDKCKKGQPAPYKGKSPVGKCERTAPQLSGGKQPSESQCVLVPDYTFAGWPEAFLPSWPSASKFLSAAAEARPWASRKAVVFWRGADTSEERKVLHESNILQPSEMTDVRLMVWTDATALRRDFVSLADHCDFRYLLHLAGISYSARLKYLLLCGSAVIFPSRRADEAVEFWHHLLKDKENVLLTDSVMLENQGSPVLQAVNALRANDTFAQHVGAAGRHLASAVLSEENVDRYWFELLTQYSALQTFAVSQHPDAVPLEAALLRHARPIEVRQRTCTVCPV